MSFWGRLFGSASVMERAADGIYNGVDKAIYTDEEKAGGFLNLLKAYEPFKLAQRLLALLIVGSYVLGCLAAGGMLVASGFVDPGFGKQIDGSARVLLELFNDQLGYLASIVTLFYFGGGVAEGVIDRIKNREKG